MLFKNKEMFDNKKVINFLHVGKTGGSTLINLLKKNKLDYKYFHSTIQNLKYVDNINIITIRNPITRAISAFNMMISILEGEKDFKNPFNKNFKKFHLSYYKKYNKFHLFKKYDINTFFENLFDSSKDIKFLIDKIEHFNISISHYLNENIINEKYNYIYHVNKQETYNQDIKSLIYKLNLKYRNIEEYMVNENINKKNILLSDKSINNLIDFFKKDYYYIGLFYKHNLIEKKYFKELYKYNDKKLNDNQIIKINNYLSY